MPYYHIFEQWSKTVNLDDFLNSPFESIDFQSSDINNGCVYIYSIELNTNDSTLQGSSFFETAKILKDAFLNQIERTIEEKMKIGQYKIDSPFIIAIKAHDWKFRYEFDNDEFIPVRDKIKPIIKNIKIYLVLYYLLTIFFTVNT